MKERMQRRFLLFSILLILTACATRNDRFEEAWLGNCYIDEVQSVPVGFPIPGAPGQLKKLRDGYRE
jgi:hypothetical protein